MKKKLVTIVINGKPIIIEIAAVPKISKWGQLEGYQVYHSKANEKIADDLSNATLLTEYVFDTIDQALKESAIIVRAKIKQFAKLNKPPKKAPKKKK